MNFHFFCPKSLQKGNPEVPAISIFLSIKLFTHFNHKESIKLMTKNEKQKVINTVTKQRLAHNFVTNPSLTLSVRVSIKIKNNNGINTEP